jgi:hypothetical protein
LDRPAPSTPCSWPAAPRDSRRQNQKNSANGAMMMTHSSSSEPKPGDDVELVISTLFVASSSRKDCPAWDGTTTV